MRVFGPKYYIYHACSDRMPSCLGTWTLWVGTWLRHNQRCALLREDRWLFHTLGGVCKRTGFRAPLPGLGVARLELTFQEVRVLLLGVLRKKPTMWGRLGP